MFGKKKPSQPSPAVPVRATPDAAEHSSSDNNKSPADDSDIDFLNDSESDNSSSASGSEIDDDEEESENVGIIDESSDQEEDNAFDVEELAHQRVLKAEADQIATKQRKVQSLSKQQKELNNRMNFAISQVTKNISLKQFNSEEFSAANFISALTKPLFQARKSIKLDERGDILPYDPTAATNSGDEEEEFDEENIFQKLDALFLQQQNSVLQEDSSTTTNSTSTELPDVPGLFFDSRPFSELFDVTLTELDSLKSGVESKIKHLTKKCKAAESVHEEKMSELQTNLVSVQSKFKRLDSRISNVSATSIRIGHQLAIVNKQKQNNQKAEQLISHFLAFNTGERSKLDPIFTTISNQTPLNQLQQAAELIQQLQLISTEVRIKDTEKATDFIAKVSNEIENEMLKRFDMASSGSAASVSEESEKKYRIQMKQAAEILFGFKGKAVVTRYVYKTMEELERHIEEVKSSSKSALFNFDSDTSIPAPLSPIVDKFRSSLHQFHQGILLLFTQQVSVCQEIFAQHSLTMLKAILERVFGEKVHNFIDNALDDNELSIEQYLQILSTAQDQTQELVKQLQKILKITSNTTATGTSATLTTSPTTSTPTSSPTSSFTTSTSSTGFTEVSFNLMEYVAGIFQRYRDTYMEKERQFLRETSLLVIQSSLSLEVKNDPLTHNLHHYEKQQSNNSTVLDKLDESDLFGRKKKLAALDAKQRWVILVLESNCVQRILAAAQVSVSRCDKLSDSTTLPDHVYSLYATVLSLVLEQFLLILYQDSVQFLPSLDPKSEPEVFFFSVIRLLNFHYDSLVQHYTEWIQPRLSTNLNTLAICETRQKELFLTMESNILAGLTRCLNSAIKYATKLLSKQKSSDYKPKDDATLYDSQPSKVCQSVGEFLAHHYEAVVLNLEGKNLDNYLTVLGLQLYDVISKHLQNTTISLLGAGLLSRDLKEYEMYARQFHIQAVNDKFADLKSIGNLFFVSVDNLKSVIYEPQSRLTKLPNTELHEFLKSRADYSSQKGKIMTALKLTDH